LYPIFLCFYLIEFWGQRGGDKKDLPNIVLCYIIFI